MSDINWTINRKGDLSIFNRDPPSCFSNRVARVRRSNSVEDRRLQDKLRSIHLEHTIRNRYIFKEQQTLVKQLNGIQTVRETPQVGLERRRLQQGNGGYPILLQRTGNSSNSVKKRVNSAQSPSVRSHSPSHVTQLTAITPYPHPECRFSYAGYRRHRSSTIPPSPYGTLTRSATVPLFTSFNESREYFGPNSIYATNTRENSDGISNASMEEALIGLPSCRLPTIENRF